MILRALARQRASRECERGNSNPAAAPRIDQRRRGLAYVDQGAGVDDMVMMSILMTMSSSRWNIASAKAELSRLVRQARRRPQVIENRGTPVAVVLSAEDFERMAEADRGAGRWRAYLALSAEIRADGGATLEVPRRRARRSPFIRARR